MPTYFCPSCWHEIEADARYCSHCGAELALLDAESIDDKLIRTLRHPDTDAVMRAVDILGRRGVTSAVQALIEKLRADPDPYLAAAIGHALAQIPGEAARSALRALLTHRSVIVRRAAREAIARRDRSRDDP